MKPSDLNCAQLGSSKYRKLCQVTSIPGDRNVSNPVFSGYPATDLLILSEFTDKELIDVCATNKYVNKLCNNESFWLNRLLDRYGSVLGSGREIHQKYIPKGTSWKEYYLWLSGLVEGDIKLARAIAAAHNREDLRLLLNTKLEKSDTLLFYVRPDMMGFLREADFGPSDINNKWSVPLRDYISTIETQVADRVNLSNLFEIYIRYNGLATSNNTIKVSPLMKKWFKLPENEYKWFIVQNLITASIAQEMLNAEQLKFLNSVELSNRLNSEKELYQSIAQHYRRI